MAKRIFLGLLLAVSALSATPGVAAESANPSSAERAFATATFAGGCFWCMEPPFDKLEGVVSTTVGYTGGHTPSPTYEQVSAGGTGHAEAVLVVYDPDRVGYTRLLDVFWRNVDPLDAGGQFCDMRAVSSATVAINIARRSFTKTRSRDDSPSD